jgi:hypothetical protein
MDAAGTLPATALTVVEKVKVTVLEPGGKVCAAQYRE